jgi:hypothetical protein
MSKILVVHATLRIHGHPPTKHALMRVFEICPLELLREIPLHRLAFNSMNAFANVYNNLLAFGQFQKQCYSSISSCPKKQYKVNTINAMKVIVIANTYNPSPAETPIVEVTQILAALVIPCTLPRD